MNVFRRYIHCAIIPAYQRGNSPLSLFRMQLLKRVIQLAKDHALIKFTALARAMVQDAENVMSQNLAEARPGLDQRLTVSALHALKREQAGIVAAIDARYRGGVERAMRTMYTDLREGLGNLSADTLSLIDDEAVNRQMEVGHLVQRLRDACDENLGRLNIIIAQLHGDAEVQERENPFRPYLIARALYESLSERIQDEEIGKILFERLSDSLARHLSNYYASICDVFDAHGIQARLLARPTKLKRHQRDQLAQQLAALNADRGAAFAAAAPAAAMSGMVNVQSPVNLNSWVLPALERMLASLRGKDTESDDEGSSVRSGAVARQFSGEALQDFVWKLFNPQQSGPFAASGITVETGGTDHKNEAAAFAPASAEVVRQIEEYQRQVAQDEPGAGIGTEENHALFDLSEKLEFPHGEQAQRMAIDVVAVLFEFILEDEQIPAAVRARIARLQVPFLKAALLEPQLLQQSDHPARVLLNRMSSAAIGLEPDSPVAQRLDGEISRLVKRILKEFEQDTSLFASCLKELEKFLADELANADAQAIRSIQAAEEAEKFSAVLHNTEKSLHEILASIEVDQRVKDFIAQVWARVLVRAAGQDAASGTASCGPQYRDVLPELVWSALPKVTAEDRSALIRMLPGLVKRLRIGMLMAQMSEDESKIQLDRLVPVHTQVLRGADLAQNPQKSPTLDDLRKEFARLVTGEDGAAWVLTEPLPVEPEVLQHALTSHGVEADMELSRPSVYSAAPSRDLLQQLQVGSSVEFRAGDTTAPARVIWVSRHHSLFIFRLDGQTKPMVYSSASLLQALQSGKIGLTEYAPAFERAVDAMMMGAEALQATRPGGTAAA